jgi:hypothetical protein
MGDGGAAPRAAGSTGLPYRVDTVTGAVVPPGNGQTTVWERQMELDPTGRYAFFYTKHLLTGAVGAGLG